MGLSRFQSVLFVVSWEEKAIYLRSLYWWFLVIAVCLLQAGIPGNLQMDCVVFSSGILLFCPMKLLTVPGFMITKCLCVCFGLRLRMSYCKA